MDTIIDNADKREGDDAVNALFRIEPMFYLNFNENWKIANQWRMRPVEDRRGYNVPNSEKYDDSEGRETRDIHLNDYGLILEELYVQYFNGDLRAVAGKYNPTFAVGWKKSRYYGVYGTDVANDNYKLREKWGGSVSAVLDDLEIRLNTFFDDTTELSNTALNQRGRDKSRGGAGNTESFSSFSLTATGEEFFGVENLSYNFGYSYLGTDLSEEKEQKGYAVSFDYLQNLGENWEFIPFFEFVRLDNVDGYAGVEHNFVTLSLPFVYNNWSFIVSDTHTFKYNVSEKDYVDYDYQISAGYKFKNGLMVDVAKRWQKEDGYKADYIGGLVSYLLTF